MSSSLTVNSHPPLLHVSGPLLVPLGASAPLPPGLLRVTDPDSPPQRLVFSLVQAPSNGELLLSGGGSTEARQLRRGDTFGWAELNAGQVRFRHRRDRARSVLGHQGRIRAARNPSGKCQVSVSGEIRRLGDALTFNGDAVKIH